MTEARTVLVTGATGFIAKHIVLELLRKGYRVIGSLRSDSRRDEVRAAIRPHLDPAEDLDRRLAFVTLDLDSDDGWLDAMSGVDVLDAHGVAPSHGPAAGRE